MNIRDQFSYARSLVQMYHQGASRCIKVHMPCVNTKKEKTTIKSRGKALFMIAAPARSTVNQCSNLQGHSRNLIPLECADAAKKCTCKLHSRLFLIRLKFENFQNKIVPGTEAHSKSKHKGPEAHSKSKHKGENHCAAFHHTRSSHKYGHSRCSEHY